MSTGTLIRNAFITTAAKRSPQTAAARHTARSTMEDDDEVLEVEDCEVLQIEDDDCEVLEANDCELLMVLDGASTTGVVQDPAYCVDIKTVDKYIKTGGQGKPNLVRCTQEGSLPVDMLVDKRRVQMLIPGFKIVPGFGVNILPECIFLKKGFEVKKKGALCQVLTPNGELILTAEALRHEDSWLFFVRVGLARKKTDAVLSTAQQ